MVIINMSSGRHFMTYVTQEFFNYMFNENLAEKCQYVVIRIVTSEESRDHNRGRQTRQSRSQEKKMSPESVMKVYGLEREKIKAKVCQYFIFTLWLL